MVKRLLYIWLTISLCCGCEVIDEKDRLIPVSAPEHSRTHVLIEYTGFRCVNCPEAAEVAEDLQQIYGDRLIVIAMHPASNPFTQGKYDYTCPAADTCYLFMGGTAATPFPTGNIDILPDENDYFLAPAEWAGQLHQLMADSLAPKLSVSEAVYTPATRTVAVQYVTERPSDCTLAVWLTEDSVMGAQAMPDGSVDMNYIHRHIMRTAAYDSPWGIVPTNDIESASFPLPEGCKPENCRVIALLLDTYNHRIRNAYETNLHINQ